MALDFPVAMSTIWMERSAEAVKRAWPSSVNVHARHDSVCELTVNSSLFCVGLYSWLPGGVDARAFPRVQHGVEAAGPETRFGKSMGREGASDVSTRLLVPRSTAAAAAAVARGASALCR